MPPTALSIDMSLSLRMMSKSLSVEETLFKPSNASPPLIAPSPMMATTLGVECWVLDDEIFDPTAMPNAAEIEFEA